MENNCPFCHLDLAESTKIYEYNHWNLFIQPLQKRQKTKGAAGFIALRNHVEKPELVADDAWLEFKSVVPDAAKRLCKAASMTYMGSESVGFNQGKDAGQTVAHAHIHILPTTSEDPFELRQRGGIGGAFEELRKNRVKT